MAAKKRPHVPTLWKVKQQGKEIGNYRTTIKGERINLGTKDPDEARRRRALALKGERSFSDDTGAVGAASAIVAALDGTGVAKTAPVVEPPRPAAPILPPAPAPAPELPSAHTVAAALPASGLQRDPARPDGYIPPADGWAESVRGAAAEAEGAAASSQAAGEGDGEGERVDADMLREMIDFAAASAVELQIWLQSWAIKRGLKIKTAVVSDDAKGREVGKKLWSRCFQRLMPTDLPIPDYIAAPVLIAALTLPLQLGEGATVVKDEEETAAGGGAQAAAAA